MSATKTVYFGSLFALNPVGVDQLVDRFRSNFPDDPASAPFIAYHEDTNVLSCPIERNDGSTPQYLLAQLKLFIDHERKKPQFIEPTIRPLDGALIRTEIDHSNSKHEVPSLIDIGINGHQPNNDPLQALEHMTTHWVPKDGEIKILTSSFAEGIAALTGCSIYPEPLEARVRLVGGDFKAALKKLENIEDLLALQYQQRRDATIKTNNDVLLRTTDEPNLVMEFERINNRDHPAYRRIIVDQGPQVLQNKCLCESRLPGAPKEDSIPPNLMLLNIAETNSISRCGVWEDFKYQTLGNEASKNPRTAVDNFEKKSALSQRTRLGTNDYIDSSKAARVAAWSGQVDESVDPNAVAPEAPEQTSTRRRKVAVDSDDSDGPDEPDEDELKNAGKRSPETIISQEEQQISIRTSPVAAAASVVAPSDLLKADEKYYGASLTPKTYKDVLPAPSSTAPEVTITSRQRLVQISSETHTTPSSLNVSQLNRGKDHNRRSPTTSALLAESSSDDRQIMTQMYSGADARLDIFADPKDAQALSSSSLATREGTSTSQPAAGQFNTLDGAYSAAASVSPEVQSAFVSQECSPDRLATSPSLPETRSKPNAYSSRTRGSPVSRPSASTLPNINRCLFETRSTASSQRRPITSPETEPKTTLTPEISPERVYKSFDPTAYGGAERVARDTLNASASGSPSGLNGKFDTTLNSNNLDLHRNHQNSGKTSPSRRRARHRERGGQMKGMKAQNAGRTATDQPYIPDARAGKEKVISEGLIDVLDEGSSMWKPCPPPGLDIRITTRALEDEPLPSPHLLDEPLQEWPQMYQVPKSDLISFSSESIVPPASDESAGYVNTKAYKGPNISALKQASLAALYARRAKKEGDQKKDDANRQEPRLHSTMSLQAGNPGKKGPQKQESKAEKKERTEQALREAYGIPSPVPSKAPGLSQAPVEMSKKKRQTLTSNLNMAAANADELQSESRRQATEALVSSLSPLLEASRAFNGEVKLEFQFGQLLVSCDSSLRGKRLNTTKWEKLFGPSAKSSILSSFTPTLTTNGADIDRALGIKASRGAKLWDLSSPGPHAVQYEFDCQSKHGKSFLLVLDQGGCHELRSSNDMTIGMVGLQCPAQIWDVCAMIYGVENWTPPVETGTSITAFINSVHVLPDRHELALVFRQPDDNELMIKTVRMKRVSLHQCLLVNHENYQLQATETKILYTKVHPEDKKLWQAYEKNHNDMINDGLVHYELSIIDKSVNEILALNKGLELGELASSSAGKTLLKEQGIEQMVDLAAHMVSKIDWMGSFNFGTLARTDAARELTRLRQQESLPPMARSKIHPLISASRIDPASRLCGGSAYNPPMSATGGSEVFIGRRYVPGTRAGTLAEIYEDEHGRFAKGFGGARVPLGVYSLLGAIQEAPLAPDDSASQIGRMRNVPGSVRTGRGVGIHGNKGLGFW